MPDYQYTDQNGHIYHATHRMLYSTGVTCTVCGAEMWRRPQPVMVSWGGLAPSQGDMPLVGKHLIATADERRDAFLKLHEQHERDGVTKFGEDGG